MSNNTVKAAVTAVTGFLSSVLGGLYIPVLLMVACNIIDYITGLLAAPNRKAKGTDTGINSYKSMVGIVKKVTMWLLVVVGAIIDALLAYAAGTLGIILPCTFLVACIVAVWIVCNELISILENMVDIGVGIPGFLMPLVKNIRSQTENLVEMDTERENTYEKKN